MNTFRLMPFLALLGMLLFSCSTEEMPDETIAPAALVEAPTAKTIEIEILERINNHRIGIGLNALNNLGIIKSVAHTHTDYMVEINEVNHDNFIQRKNSLVQHADALTVSENVAYGYNSAEAVVNAWLNSEGHRANLEGNYTDFEISAEQNSEGRWFYTNIFIKK